MKTLQVFLLGMVIGGMAGLALANRYAVISGPVLSTGRYSGSSFSYFVKVDRLTGKTWAVFVGGFSDEDYTELGRWFPIAHYEEPEPQEPQPTNGLSQQLKPSYTNKLDLQPFVPPRPDEIIR